MKQLSDFRNIHKDRKFICCGLGFSLNILSIKLLECSIPNCIIIGVNDIERMGIIPHYLIFGDKFKDMAKKPFDIENDRGRFIKYFMADYLFLHSYSDNITEFPEHQFDKIINAPAEKFTSEYDKSRYYHTMHSPFMAVSLAIYMGAKKIGIIGVDFNGNHAWGVRNETYTSLFKRLDEVNRDFAKIKELNPDIEFYNFSLSSRVDAFDKIHLEDF